MVEYADLEIRILELQETGYPVEMTLDSEQEFGRGYLDPGFLPWVSSGSPEMDGERLFNWLLADPALKSAWAEVRGQRPKRRIRLRLDDTTPELHAIPWEVLRDPGDGIAAIDLAAAASTPFSRYLAGRWQPGRPVLQRPIRVLVAIANPENLPEFKLPSVEVVEEMALLEKAVEGRNITLELLPQPCSLPALEAGLKKGYHILHFIGHGAYRSKTNQAALYLADEDNQVKMVYDEDIAGMLARQLRDSDLGQDERLRMIFLASCQTANRSPADAFRGLAPQLVAAGVPAVLAMQELVPVDTSRKFSATFYHQLMNHGLVDLAANEARSSVLSSDLSGAAIPVLFSRLRSSQLLGQRGRISGDQGAAFWPIVLDNILDKRTTPFLGPQVTAGLLPSRTTIASQLAKRIDYPLSDNNKLAQVAQYYEFRDSRGLRKNYLRLLVNGLANFLEVEKTPGQKKRFMSATLTEVTEELGWAEKVMSLRETEIHHQLADFELPLYLTTNIDNFMVEALKHKEMAPRRLGLTWKQSEAREEKQVIKPAPSSESPVVFHLNGHDGEEEQLRHMVLSEDDHLEHFVRLSRDQEAVLPITLIEMLVENSYLFLGFRLDDWEFRTILQGLLKTITQHEQERKTHVGVQLELEDSTDPKAAMKYLEEYLNKGFNIHIYWGSAIQFVNELHARWQRFVELGEEDL